jgi:hypothetical protein
MAVARSISAPLSTAPEGPEASVASWILGGWGIGGGFAFFLAAMPAHFTVSRGKKERERKQEKRKADASLGT